MQLFDLLPHVTRLVPLAERYFATKQVGDGGAVPDAAFVSIAEDVRGDLNQVTKAHAVLYRQLQDQGNQIAELSEEVRRTRALAEQSERRIGTVDGKVDSLEIWIKAGVVLMVILIALVLVLLLRGH